VLAAAPAGMVAAIGIAVDQLPVVWRRCRVVRGVEPEGMRLRKCRATLVAESAV
jgi:hypothetical protein